MNRFKLQKGKSLFDYIRDSIDVPIPIELWPSSLMGRSVVRIIHEPTQDLIEQFATLLTADRQILCDARYSPLMRSYTLPNCHIILATPADAPGLVIGGIMFVHLSDSELSYVAALYVRRDFRGRRIGHTLFDEFQRSFDHPQRIAFCDFARSERARLRPSLFPIEGRYSIRRVIGFAANIALAAGELIAAYGKTEDDDPLPKVCSFADSLPIDKVAEFDAIVAGRDRSVALEKVQQMEGFVGIVAKDRSDCVVGYAISMPGVGSREITVGPIYAINLLTAICLLRDLCRAMNEDKIVCVHVPHMGHRMLRFLHDKALCEVDKQFDRFYTRCVDVPADDFSKVFAISAKVILPDC